MESEKCLFIQLLIIPHLLLSPSTKPIKQLPNKLDPLIFFILLKQAEQIKNMQNV